VYTDVSYTWQDLFNEYDAPPPIIERAVKAGAAAILWTGERERKLLYRHTNSTNGELERLPQAVVAREDALRLMRVAMGNPGKVRLRLTMPNKIGGPAEQFNVVGEIRGYEKPDEVVVLGAHLDSWELGTGALDNGCNAALVIEAARAIKASGLLPRRTIRFVLFSGEEEGMLGSHAYVRAHRAELDKYRGVVVFDSGVGRVTGYSLGGRHDIEDAIRGILKPFAGWGVDDHTFDATTGTDHLDFLLEGVPTLVANQEVANYLENYHAASDTFGVEHGAGSGDGLGYCRPRRAHRQEAIASRGRGAGETNRLGPRVEGERDVERFSKRGARKTALEVGSSTYVTNL
jgi:hypothetical protein